MAKRTWMLLGGLALCAPCFAGVCGCRNGTSDSAVPVADAHHAQCLVCKSEGDLACVDVQIREDTPRTVYRGEMYYFCSTQCRSDFEKQPEKYLKH